MTLTINNFQSIAKADIEFKGYSVIVGKSDMGKSAVRRAITAVLFNNWSSNYRRFNTQKTEVKLVTDSDEVSFTKSNSINSFIVNGKEISKIGKDSPDIGGYRQDLNITTQLESLYMVSYKDSENTKILNNLFGIDLIEAAQALCSSDLRKSKIELNQLEVQIADKVKEVEPLKRTLLQMEELTSLLDEVGLLVGWIDEYMLSLSDIEGVNLRVLELGKVLSRVDKGLMILEAIESMYKYIGLVAEVERLKRELNSLPNITTKTEPLENLILLETYLQTHNQVLTLKDKVKRLSIDFTPARNLSILVSFISNMEAVETLKDKVKDIDSKILEISSEIEKYNICPTCGNILK